MKKFALAVLGLAPLLSAQSLARSFELTAVRPAPADDARRPQLQFLPGNRVVAVNYPLWMLIATAWGVPFNQSPRMTGVPEWARTTRYNVTAQAGKGSIKPGLPPRERNAELRKMLRTMLADRFHLEVREETKELPVFAVVVAKGGLKLEKSAIEEKDCAETCHQIQGGQGRGLHTDAASLADLAQYVENWAERPVLDRTDVTGLFRIQTSGWAPLRPGPPPAAGAKAEDGTNVADLPTLFEVFEGMGLKLEAERAPIDVYRVEHIDRPSEN